MRHRITYFVVFALIVTAALLEAFGRAPSRHRAGSDPMRPADPPASSPAGASSKAKISIDNFAFKPRELSVPVGATVTWMNHDDVPHTATSAGEPTLFDSKALDTDGTFSFTFTRPGTYRYFCKVHPHMTGTVIVK